MDGDRIQKVLTPSAFDIRLFIIRKSAGEYLRRRRIRLWRRLSINDFRMTKLWRSALAHTPPPHAAVFRIDHFPYELHTDLLEDFRRCVWFRKSMSDNGIDFGR